MRFFLALCFLIAALVQANAASRFWVGGTGTWDASDTTHWSATSGGAGGVSVPGSGDTVTLDASSGGGTVTVNTTVTVTSITAGAFTGTLDFAANNNNVTASTVSFSGTGTRTINMGSGTWTVTGTSATPFDCTTVTNLTASFASANLVYSANAAFRQFQGGGQSYGALTVNSNSTKGSVNVAGTNTFGAVTINDGNFLYFPQGVTTTISGALNGTGTSSAQIGVMSNSATAVATLSVGSASTLTWAGVSRITKAGAGSITATNSFDLGNNTTVTITVPSTGGGGHVIGGGI